MIDYQLQGKQNRAKGLRFERKVRKYIEERPEWTVAKWQNKGLHEPAKLGKFRTNQGGFPDFIVLGSDVHFVEAKFNGRLSKEEVEMMDEIHKKYPCWIASDDNGEIKWTEFVDYKKACRLRRKRAENKAG